MQVLVSPETHSRLAEQAARVLASRDFRELGRKASPVERIETEAAARADASRLIDQLVELVQARRPIQIQDRVVL